MIWEGVFYSNADMRGLFFFFTKIQMWEGIFTPLQMWVIKSIFTCEAHILTVEPRRHRKTHKTTRPPASPHRTSTGEDNQTQRTSRETRYVYIMIFRIINKVPKGKQQWSCILFVLNFFHSINQSILYIIQFNTFIQCN